MPLPFLARMEEVMMMVYIIRFMDATRIVNNSTPILLITS
jgi:hypothetical protein